MVIADEDLEELRKEFGTIEYDPPPNLVYPKAGTYEAVVLQYDERDVCVETRDGVRHWLFRIYAHLPFNVQIDKLNRKRTK